MLVRDGLRSDKNKKRCERRRPARGEWGYPTWDGDCDLLRWQGGGVCGVKNDGDTVGGKGCRLILVQTAAYGGMMICAAREFAQDVTRQLRHVRVLPTHHQARADGTEAAIGCAIGASLAGITKHRDSAGAQLGGDGRLDLRLRKHGYGARVISYGIELTVARHDCQTNAINRWIEQIGAVLRGVHPSLLNSRSIGTGGNILFNETEVGASLAGAQRDIIFVAITMFDLAGAGHEHAVLHGAGGKRRIPLQRGKAVACARLISKRVELIHVILH
jgi:hypothetical protein